MSRVFVVMLAYNRYDVINGAIKNFQQTAPYNDSIIRHIFDPGYPLNEGCQSIEKMAEMYGWKYTKIENKGVMGNWNQVIHEHLDMKDDDYLVTFDPDVRMDKSGWIEAMIDALSQDENHVFCASSMWFNCHEWMYQPPYNRTVRTTPLGTNVAKYDCLIAWASGMWKASFLITRPKDFAMRNKYYGWAEHADYDRMLAHGKTWVQVADYIDRHLPSPDVKYTEWKQASASGTTDKDFKEWLGVS